MQAYIAARTEREERAKALSLLASSFGLGTVIGPALAHFLVFEPLGLAGPLIVFACFGLLVLLALRLRLPNDTPRFEARGVVTAYPNAASVNQPPPEDDSNALPQEEVRLRWREDRLKSWLIAGLLGGHAQAILLGVVGFLVRDRLGLQDLPKRSGSGHRVGDVRRRNCDTAGAMGADTDPFDRSPRNSVLWGSLLALLGVTLTGISHDFYGITMGFAVASLGFGLYRPGFTAGASLAVRRHEQGDVAGKIASINGSAYIVAPAIGVALFNWWEPVTFILIGASLLFLIVWGRGALSEAR